MTLYIKHNTIELIEKNNFEIFFGHFNKYYTFI